MNLGVEYGNCGHRGVVDGAKLWRWFAVHRWNDAKAKVAEEPICEANWRCHASLRRQEPDLMLGVQ
jgi:hypothetical protein